MAFVCRHHVWSVGSVADAVLPRSDFEFDGTPGDDRIRGSGLKDYIDVSQGGDDRIGARGGDDTVYFGAAFTGADKVVGGKGVDTVILDGDYSAGVEVQADSFDRIERLVLEGGPYEITGVLDFKDTLGRTLVDASALTEGQDLHLSVTSLGDLNVLGGAGDDILDASSQSATKSSNLYGFSGDDVLIGGAGEYHLIGGYGADRIVSNSDETEITYLESRESVARDYDTIERFQGKLRFLFDSDTSTPGFDRDFSFEKTADRTGNILIKYDAGSDETIVKVFTDPDHKADFVLHLTGDVPLTPADFIFG
jgi:Ca2+-binding RTX toxin-like protein